MQKLRSRKPVWQDESKVEDGRRWGKGDMEGPGMGEIR